MKKTRGENGHYRGRSKATIDLLRACREIIEEVQPITVRGVCYRLFVAGLIDSMATKNTQKVSRLLVWAREEGLIPWEWIVDDSRRMEGDGGFTDLKEYASIIEKSYRRDFWAHQVDRVIVVSEKATVAGIVRPVLDELGVPFFAVHGFNSATKIYDLCQEIHQDNRVYYFLYIGDHDPSGMFMSEEDFPQRLERYTPLDPRLKHLGIKKDKLCKFMVKRIALTTEDTGSLPSFPAKEKDPRYEWYLDEYDTEEAWELDAMDPNVLRDRVRREIKKHVNAEDWEQHKKIEAAQKETTERIAKAMAEAAK